jgi:DNA modification methylase
MKLTHYLELGRKAVLIELNSEYIRLIKSRCDTNIGLGI